MVLDMRSLSRFAAPTVPKADVGGLADQGFWLARLSDDLPRAAIVPDYKRSTAVAREYERVGFTIEPEVVRVLKSLDPGRGVSDRELCAAVLGVLLGRHQREDSLIVGLLAGGGEEGAPAVAPLRIPCHPETTFGTLVAELGGQIEEMSAHALPSVAELLQVLGVEAGSHRFPLFDIALAVGSTDTAIDLQAYPVDMAFLFQTSGGEIRGEAVYAAELYERATVERLTGQMRLAAQHIAARPTTPLGQVGLLSASEQRQVLVDFNHASADFPLTSTLHGLFEAQAGRTPEAPAVIHRDRQLSYGEVEASANRLANTLLAQGLAKGAFVGILLERSCDFVVAMLGVFKAGGAYVPLDPTYPRDRIRHMLDDSEAAFVVSDARTLSDYAEVFSGSAALRAVVSLSGSVSREALPDPGGLTLVQPEHLAAASASQPGLALNGRDRAYMIYTSGSTGHPKGAICRHDGALNHLFGELAGLSIEGPFRFLQSAASSSDISVWQFLAPLVVGGSTVIADYEVVVDPALLLAAMRQHAVDLAEPVPVVLRALIDLVGTLPAEQRALPALRCMMCTGEALPGELVDRWLALYPTIPLANTYGPTETSDDVTLIVLRQALAQRYAVAPIGYPLPNVRLFILDRALQALPVGVPGEICIAGVAVGEGYWRQPEKTAAAFVACPYPEIAAGPMYRTGDLGRWLPDGSIEFLGRIDQQVKVRGYRIEPGEIESVLTQYPGVQDAAVVALEDALGNRRLIGYYVAGPGTAVSPGDLRRYLKAELADHMVPALLMPLAALPLTPLGKVDRRALARMEAHTSASEDHVAPRNALEEAVAAAWARCLGRALVGIHDNFFEIGGDSILTLQVVSELRQRGHDVAPRQIFRHPTVAELAAYLASVPSRRAQRDEDTQAGGERDWSAARWREQLAGMFPQVLDVYPLSATQRGIYFQSLLAPRTSGAYIEQVCFDLIGDLDEACFARAWQQVADEEAMLRTAVVRRGAPYPLQVLVPAVAFVPTFIDERTVAAEQQPGRLASLLAEERMKGFDLKRPPLSRVLVVRLADRRYHLMWTYHHVILDGWSEPLLLNAVFRAYDALLAGQEPATGSGAPYRDFVAWLEGQDYTPAERYWRQQLAGFTDPVSIKDKSPALTPPSSNEIWHAWEELEFSGESAAPLAQLTRRNAITFSTLIHGVWALLLHAQTQAEDVVFGSVASGRQCGLPGIETTRGLVVVTQPLRSRLVHDATVASWLRLLQLQMAEMREYEHTPLTLIQQWCEVAPEKRPLLDSIVVVGNYSGSDLQTCRPASMELTDVRYVTQPLYALTLFVVTAPHLTVRLVYDRKRYAAETIRALLADYRALLLRIAENPEQRVTSMVNRQRA